MGARLINTGEPSARNERLTYRANQTHGRHGWLRLTPAYSLHLVRTLVAELPRDTLVLDPFCGTGTTALTCAQTGIPCHTTDINPFLVWLANAKCAPYPEPTLVAAHAALPHLLAWNDDETTDPWLPPLKNIHKWWPAPTLHGLGHIYARLCAAPLDAAARDLLRIIFCRVAIASAAVDFGHQSMSFKQPTTSSATQAHAHLAHLLTCASDDILRSAREPIPAHLGHAYLGDARDLRATLPGDYHAIITSPPYPNRMSYIRELRPYMYWLGYLGTGHDAGTLDWQAIGGTWGCATSNLNRWTPDPTYPEPHPHLATIVAHISQRSQLLGRYIARYFEDTQRHIRALLPLLAAGAHLHYIVGNSKFYDVVVPTEEIYAAIFRTHGLSNIRIETVRKRSSKKELFEYLVSARA